MNNIYKLNDNKKKSLFLNSSPLPSRRESQLDWLSDESIGITKEQRKDEELVGHLKYLYIHS